LPFATATANASCLAVGAIAAPFMRIWRGNLVPMLSLLLGHAASSRHCRLKITRALLAYELNARTTRIRDDSMSVRFQNLPILANINMPTASSPTGRLPTERQNAYVAALITVAVPRRPARSGASPARARSMAPRPSGRESFLASCATSGYRPAQRLLLLSLEA